MQSRGQWGTRDFDKLMFELPIPLFNVKDPYTRNSQRQPNAPQRSPPASPSKRARTSSPPASTSAPPSTTTALPKR